MNRFVFVALLLMGWAYWELSGGAGFAPETRIPAADSGVTVTRADTSSIDAPAMVEPLAAEPSTPETADAVAAAEPVVANDEADLVEMLVHEVESAPDFAENPLTATATAAEPATEPEIATATAPGTADLRVVTGSRVNLREGPGTSYGTIGQVVSGTILEVIETNGGWAHIQVQGTAENGWMSADFLTPLNG